MTCKLRRTNFFNLFQNNTFTGARYGAFVRSYPEPAYIPGSNTPTNSGNMPYPGVVGSISRNNTFINSIRVDVCYYVWRGSTPTAQASMTVWEKLQTNKAQGITSATALNFAGTELSASTQPIPLASGNVDYHVFYNNTIIATP